MLPGLIRHEHRCDYCYRQSSHKLSSTTGTITASDTVLSAINKLDGNDALKAPLASPSFTGVINIPATTSATSGVIQMNGSPFIHAPGSGSNVFLGFAGNFTLTGILNTVTGPAALSSDTTGSQNTATGHSALFNNTTASQNTAVGYRALVSNTTGADNTAIGWKAGGTGALMTGSQNTATGSGALTTNTTGPRNTVTGYQTLSVNTTGGDNTALGWSALHNSTGSNNIGVGSAAGQNITTGSNNIHIGNVGAVESNTIRIGTSGTQTATFIAGINGVTLSPAGAAVFVNSNGQLGTVNSSRRFKTDIKPMDDASDVLLSLKPVAFHYKPEIDAKGIPQFGLIAEEVAEVCPDLVIRDEKGEIQTVRYEQVNAMLLNEFLKQHRRIAEMKKEEQSQLAALRSENAKLRAENDANAKRLVALETRDKERDARLTRLEISMPAAQPVANTIASNKAGGQ